MPKSKDRNIKSKSTSETKMNPRKQVYMQDKGAAYPNKKMNKNGMYNKKGGMKDGY